MTIADRTVRAKAFAKINLSLRVIGGRADGYHELRTIFQSLALHDTITFTAARGPFVLECDDPACPADRTNLVWRAASRVWRAAGRRGEPAGWRARIVKRIPMQAGLGGGSSDAAAALRVCGRLWRVADHRLRTIGRELGADVPFFFEGGTVLGLERGDLLFPLVDAPPGWAVLVVPPFGIATRDAFRWYDDDVHRRAAGQNARRTFARTADGVNDLQDPVDRRQPAIGRLVRRLNRSGARLAAMTGSGAAVFGLFDTRDRAEEAATGVAGAGRIVLTRTLTRRAYTRQSMPHVLHVAAEA